MSIKTIISWNVNGIRPRSSQLQHLIDEYNPEIICLQEIKANEEQTLKALQQYMNVYKYIYVNPSKSRKGYSGTMVMSQYKAKKYEEGNDSEGRLQIISIKGLLIYNAYVPNAQENIVRLPYKEQFMNNLQEDIKQRKERNIIVCADFNVAQEAQDLTNWKAKQRSTGFTLEERELMKDFMEELKLIDVFRYFNPNVQKYSYRDYRSKKSYWRIDTSLARENTIKNKIKSQDILQDYGTSDHFPVVLQFK